MEAKRYKGEDGVSEDASEDAETIRWGDAEREKFPVSPRPHLPASSSPESPFQIKGVIFDLDGVLTDTSELHYLSWKQLAQEEGILFNREVYEGMLGLPRRESLLHLLGDRTVIEVQIQEMMERKNGYYLKLMQQLTPDNLLPGVANLLQELETTGIKIALGSSSRNARTVLKRLGIAEKFDAIADGDSVSQPKPAPDIFLHAAHQLSLSPSQCLVLEDAAAGVEAALAAGMQTVGLGPVERVGKAHVVLPSLAEVGWQDLQQQLINKVTVSK